MIWKKIMMVNLLVVLMDSLPLFPIRDRIFEDLPECFHATVTCEMRYPYNSRQREDCINRCLMGDEWFSLSWVSPRKHNPSRRYKTDQKLDEAASEANYTYPTHTKEGRKLWEGDMVLSDNQVDSYYNVELGRKARDDPDYYWPNAVVYYSIHEDSEENRDVINAAIQHWMENTCLRFRQVSLHSSFPHIRFKKLQGCYSSVGREATENPNGQDLSIGEGCEEVGTIIHEIGHSVGFFHEHARPDRDSYVKILYDNIKPQHRTNFQIAHINDFGIPYDLGSVMHYKPREFTSNGRNTIVPLNPLQHYVIGQRKQLSFYDIKIANIMYKCNEHCRARRTCRNEGYLDKTCRCRCPATFTGKTCEIPVRETSSDENCVKLISQSTTIVSPGYPYVYPADTRCIWKIKVSPATKVELTFQDFDLALRNEENENCRRDNVEIRIHDKYDGEFFCGEELLGKTLYSSGKDIYIMFRTKFNENRGFQASINYRYR